jgi:hypothetical protein
MQQKMWRTAVLCCARHAQTPRSAPTPTDPPHTRIISPRSIIFCEAVAIYGVIIAIILQTKVEYTAPLPGGGYPQSTMTSGYAILASGLTVGLANLVGRCSLIPAGPQLDPSLTPPA